MTDLSQTIAPRSDQMNADDLIGGPKTIRVSRVEKMQSPEQPIAIFFDGDGGKPYKPGLSMRRVLVRLWGNDGNTYVGRRMTLYRDDKVRFGGMDVGGIRISHMSGLDGAVTMPLTDKKGSRKPFKVEPLRDERGPEPKKAAEGAPNGSAPRRSKADFFADARAVAAEGSFALANWRSGLNGRLQSALAEIADELDVAAEEADGRLAKPADDFPGFTPADEVAA